MKKILLAICLIALIGNCNAQKPKKKSLEIQVKVLEQIDKSEFYEEKGVFYSANIDLINNTDTVIRFWAWTCEWQDNWFCNEDSIEVYCQGCDKNFLTVREIKPGETFTYDATLKILCNLESIKGKDIKLGFILIKEKEFEMSLDFGIDEMNDFLRLVYDKHKKGKDIFWSNSFNIN